MGTSKKPQPKEKLIKVPARIHQKVKIKAAQKGTSMGKIVGEWADKD